jgi:hypothetical protein
MLLRFIIPLLGQMANFVSARCVRETRKIERQKHWQIFKTKWQIFSTGRGKKNMGAGNETLVWV